MPRRSGDPRVRDRGREDREAWAAWQQLRQRPSLSSRFVMVEELMRVAEHQAPTRQP